MESGHEYTAYDRGGTGNEGVFSAVSILAPAARGVKSFTHGKPTKIESENRAIR
jgi:hypothetical protein